MTKKLVGAAPSGATDAATKGYVDGLVPAAVSTLSVAGGGSTNDYALAGNVTSLIVTVTTGSSQSLTGVTPGTNRNGNLLTITNGNSGTGSLIVTHESGSSTGANRFVLPNNTPLTLAPKDSATFVYDTAISRWSLTANVGTSAMVVNTGVRRDNNGNFQANNPTATQDVANKSYVDAAQDSEPWKAAVRVASTATITLSAPGTTIDGVTMATGDRFLAKDQSTASQNGIYVFATSATSATRATDMDAAVEFEGAIVPVRLGTTNAGTVWRQTATGVTVGSTSIAFTSFGAGGSGVSTATANTLVQRDANARAAFADPSATDDAATKNYVDVTAGTSAITASTLVRRDGSSRFKAGDPSALDDVATKNYVDGVLGGTYVWKIAVRAASTANITLSAPGTTIDAVTMATSDRFLAKNQTTASENGIYVWNGSAVAATRAADADTMNDIALARVSVREGSTNFSSMWLQTVNAGTLGSTSLTWILYENSSNVANTVVKRDSSARAQFANPSAAQDAATKSYVDTVSLGLAPNIQPLTGGTTYNNYDFGGSLTNNTELIEVSITGGASAAILTGVLFNPGSVARVGLPLTIFNLESSTQPLTISYESASSSASNRFHAPYVPQLLPGEAATFFYDLTALRWNVIGGTGAATSALTNNTIVKRDSNANFRTSSPVAANDAANKTYVDNVGSGGSLNFTAIATPSAPSAGTVQVFDKSVGGRPMLAAIGPTGEDFALQPHVGGKNIAWAAVAAGATSLASTFGLSMTATGTGTAAPPASTSLFTSMKRVEYLVTAAATTAVAGLHTPTPYLWRGNAARLGGFHVRMIAGPATGISNTTDRFFMGITALATAPTDAQPSAMVNMVGIGWDAADATVQIMTNDASGTATKASLATLTKASADRTAVYQLDLYAAPNGSAITYVVTDVTNNVATSGTLSTDLPANTAFMGPRIYSSVGGTSSVTGFGIFGLYTETDL